MYLLWNYDGRMYFNLSLETVLKACDVALKDVTVVPGESIAMYNWSPDYIRGTLNVAALKVPIDEEGRLLINWPTTRLKEWNEVFTHIPFLAVEDVSRIRDQMVSCDEQLEVQLTALSEHSFGGARRAIKMDAELSENPEQLRRTLDENEREMLSSGLARMVAKVRGEELTGNDEDTRALKRLKAFFEDIKALKVRKAELAGQEGELLARLKELIAGKICIIGETASLTPDLKHVPVGPAYPGVFFHSAVINQILTQQFIREAPHLVNVVVILALCVVVSMLVSRRSVFQASVFTLLLVIIFGGVVFYLFSEKMVYLKAGFAPIGMVSCYVIMTAYRQLTEEREKRKIRTLFEHYNSPAMVEQMVQDPSRVRLGGEERQLTVFFSDIEGFTSISERMPPERLVAFLNRYLGAMTDIILESGGTLDKYEGDAIIAFWGAPLSLENHARSACLAAIDSQKKLAELRRAFSAEGLPEVRCRIGLSSGEMIVGNMGSSQRFDYTVMGDAVNLGQRLEVSNKLYGTQIMISQTTYELAKEAIDARELDLLKVKGKAKPVKVYELLGRKGETPEVARKMLPPFAEGLQRYREMRWDDAIDIFSEVLRLHPGDGPARALLERCRAFKNSPPGDDWDGSFSSELK
jgi:class 3 adenylate cyclase